MADDIIAKLKESKLSGRSGSGFPTGLKWEMIINEKASKKYIVCNAASGEPKVMKDEYLLQNHPEEIVEGIKIALQTINNSSAYLYLRKDFFRRPHGKTDKTDQLLLLQSTFCWHLQI